MVKPLFYGIFLGKNNAIIIREYHALVIVFILYLEIVSTPFIGRSKGGKNIVWLQKSLTRLKATEVLVKSGGRKYAGSFIQSYAENSMTGEYYLTVDKQIGQLFEPAYAKMLLDIRLSLSTDLSRWLYAFISSQKPRRLHSIGVEKLQALSGSSSSIREFRRKLKRDLPALEQAGILDHWYIRDGDVLEYRRKPPIAGV